MFYVGAERRNPVQCEAAWRRRVDAEETAAVRATTASLSSWGGPGDFAMITGLGHRLSTAGSSHRGGATSSTSAAGSLRKKSGLTPEIDSAAQKLSARNYRPQGSLCASARGSVCGSAAGSRHGSGSQLSCGDRSTVLSLELELERERREAVERELEMLRARLAA